MLADGVEASVRSLASRDEPAIRAMVSRIIEERLGRPVRRVRPDPARHRADPRGVRRSSCSACTTSGSPTRRTRSSSSSRAARPPATRRPPIGAGDASRTGPGRRGAIDLSVREDVPRVVPATRLARPSAAALDAAGAPSPASIGADPDRRRRARRAQRGPTWARRADRRAVVPAAAPGGFPPHPGGRRGRGAAPTAGVRAPARGAAPPGRLVVSVERAIEQATAGRGGQTGDVRWTPADELRLLVTHGSLHLCGWDHAEPEEEAAMRALERRLLADG